MSNRLEDENRPEIIDVGAGRAAHHQIVERLEKTITVIVVQHRTWMQPLCRRALH